jgi:hypothetical protein
MRSMVAPAEVVGAAIQRARATIETIYAEARICVA